MRELNKREAVEHLAFQGGTIIHQMFDVGVIGVGTAAWYGRALEIVREP